MCTYGQEEVPIAGAARLGQGWRPLASAIVYVDHPLRAMADHVLTIDLADTTGTGTRLLIEVELGTARTLAAAINRAIDEAVGTLRGDPSTSPSLGYPAS